MIPARDAYLMAVSVEVACMAVCPARQSRGGLSVSERARSSASCTLRIRRMRTQSRGAASLRPRAPCGYEPALEPVCHRWIKGTYDASLRVLAKLVCFVDRGS
jgi:hypothetical protein